MVGTIAMCDYESEYVVSIDPIITHGCAFILLCNFRLATPVASNRGELILM